FVAWGFIMKIFRPCYGGTVVEIGWFLDRNRVLTWWDRISQHGLEL
ncbi:21023_t:CDS:2, partial [Gigaspora margarita]